MREKQQKVRDPSAPPGDSSGPGQRELSPEDEARVSAFLERGVNAVPRKPFRPLRLLFILTLIVLGLSLFSQWLARWAGVY